MEALPLRIREVRLLEHDVRLRLPFRFGVVTLREAVQAFVRIEAEDATGSCKVGVGAELLVPKWFDKRPGWSERDNVEQLRASLRRAAAGLCGRGAATAFEHHRAHAPAGPDVPGLVAGFGPALVDRAVADAACRLGGVSFWDAARGGLLGIELRALGLSEPGFDERGFLGSLAPRRRVALRHTIGLADALGTGWPEDAPDDGLPVTLAEVVRIQHPRFFKIKVSGDPTSDPARLLEIAGVLAREAGDFRVTLDGNEQFASAAETLRWLEAIRATAGLEDLLARVLYLEQPIARARALLEDVRELARFRPVIVDESDDADDAFERARARGYEGVSSKACKGLYRSLLNAARCAAWNRSEGRARYRLSGEDLTTQAGVAVQQDLALAALLGIEHVERNGHHYVNGMWGAGDEEMDAFARAHPDLYARSARGLHLRVEDGTLALDSLGAPGFARGAEPDWSRMRELAS